MSTNDDKLVNATVRYVMYMTQNRAYSLSKMYTREYKLRCTRENTNYSK